MTPDTPLDIQWFAYALNENGVLDDAGAQALREELGNTDDLGVFAQTIVERLCAEIEDEAEQEAVIEQIQQLVDFACEHADSGELPESAGYSEEAVYEDAAEAPQAEAGQDAEPEFVPPPAEKGKGISQESDFHEFAVRVLTMIVAEASREFEKLPIVEYVDILRNIL